MQTSDASRLAWLTESRDVVLLYWPDDAEEAARLESEGRARLLLVEPGARPPNSGSCLEDWLTLPVRDVELQTRLASLAKRAASHPRPPAVDNLGQLTYRGRSLFLSPIDQRLAHLLVENYGSIVTEADLIQTVWPDGASNQTLRVHVSRLRQRLSPIGLTIKCARAAGYVMTGSEPDEPHLHSS
jgi:hypothetical protein